MIFLEEKLIIRNFGPISGVELNLRRVNVLIGDPGTGKSTVAKVFKSLGGNFIVKENCEDEI